MKPVVAEHFLQPTLQRSCGCSKGVIHNGARPLQPLLDPPLILRRPLCSVSRLCSASRKRRIRLRRSRRLRTSCQSGVCLLNAIGRRRPARATPRYSRTLTGDAFSQARNSALSASVSGPSSILSNHSAALSVASNFCCLIVWFPFPADKARYPAQDTSSPCLVTCP